MKYAWIQEHSGTWPVDRMCEVMNVSRTSYYYWLKHGSRSDDPMLLKLIQEPFESSMQSYGTRRIKQPNKAYVGDITYIRWVYLAMVLDLYARTIVGWAIDDRLHTPLVMEALKKVRSKRTTLKNAIFHSDRGIQYASDAYKKLLRNYGMIQSMSAKGNSYDNAVAESFFHSLKTEFVYHCTFQTKQEAETGIKHYINFYNRTRLHSYNNYKSPIEKELQWWHQHQMLRNA